MTTYSAVTAGEIDSDSPVTDTLVGKLANNPIAIAEGDPSVPSNLLPMALLGTLTTTSGSTQTLSGLTLTNYKFLIFVWNGVSQNATGGTFSVGGATGCMVSLTGAASNTVSGMAWVELATGLLLAVSAETGSTTKTAIGASGYSTATTSVSVSTSGTFDAGSVNVYGQK